MGESIPIDDLRKAYVALKRILREEETFRMSCRLDHPERKEYWDARVSQARKAQDHLELLAGALGDKYDVFMQPGLIDDRSEG